MILVIDCGNTLIKIGLFNLDGTLVHTSSLNTDHNKSSDEYRILIKSLLNDFQDIEGAIISSVVPSITERISEAIYHCFNVKSLIVNKSLKTRLPIKIDNPSELGSDMLCGALSAYRKYNEPLLVCDLGTATKMYVVDKNGAFSGGIITSGIGVTLKSLVDSASLLSEVPLTLPKKVVGRNTKDCIQSGILYGHIYQIREFSKAIEKELGYSLKKIITGGYSKLLINELPEFIYEKDLLLAGLFYIYKDNSSYGK